MKAPAATFSHSASGSRSMSPVLLCCALVLLTSGLIHGLIWAIFATPWEGSTSLRKPILFGLSGGATLWSIAWVWSKLSPWKVDPLLRWVLAISLLAEVTLITAQIWRGQPSHFNRGTWFDARMDDLSLWLISVSVLVLVLLALRCSGQVAADPPTRLAIRAGMVLLVISCALGYATSILGYWQLETGHSPETYGQAGVLKFPHGACLHALQTLPLLGWMLARFRLPTSLKQMRWWVLAHVCFLLYALWQTGTGRPRLDDNLIGLILLGGMFLSAGLAIWPAVWKTISPGWDEPTEIPDTEGFLRRQPVEVREASDPTL